MVLTHVYYSPLYNGTCIGGLILPSFTHVYVTYQLAWLIIYLISSASTKVDEPLTWLSVYQGVYLRQGIKAHLSVILVTECGSDTAYSAVIPNQIWGGFLTMQEDHYK